MYVAEEGFRSQSAFGGTQYLVRRTDLIDEHPKDVHSHTYIHMHQFSRCVDIIAGKALGCPCTKGLAQPIRNWLCDKRVYLSAN